jgi:uncharacterized protein (TIGR03086 family)
VSTLSFERSAATFRAVLLEVRPEQLHEPTPCLPLDVEQLVVKAIGHQAWVRHALAGIETSRDYPAIDPAEFVASFDRSTAAMIEDLNQPGAMVRTVTLAAGLTFPGSDIAILATRNIFQYGWDLARAINQSTDLAPNLARELLEVSRTHLVRQRGPNGFFGPECPPPADSTPADALAGFLGREL